MKKIFAETFSAFIGQNAIENWSLLDISEENDLFFHLTSFPSCYVIIKTQKITKEIIEKGALLCKENTKYKNLRNIYIDYTYVSNVEKGDIVGEIIYKRKKLVKKIKLF